jgi:alcohol dehydrogenase class IV
VVSVNPDGGPKAPNPVPGIRRFEFATARRIVFGAGALRDAGEIAAGLGRRPLVVTGRTAERARPLLALLAERGAEPASLAVEGEPDVEIVRLGTAFARAQRCDCVIGFGGGAALDAAKAIAILATNPGDVMDYLEIIGGGKTLGEPPLPCVAVPTTAGTGSEVTRNSVITSREHQVKVSLRNLMMLPTLAVVDPELTYGLPPALTASTGLDALTQLIEPFVCTRANPMTDGLCLEGIPRVARSLRPAFGGERGAPASGAGAAQGATAVGAAAHPGAETGAGAVDPALAAAREDMALASLFGGLALANAGLGAVHGLAGPLGGMIDAPHGAVCAALLPVVVEANLRALRARAPESPALPRYRRVARLLTGNPAAETDDAVAWLRQLVADLGVPGLGAYGAGPSVVAELAGKAARAAAMKANPIELTREELAAIIEGAL